MLEKKKYIQVQMYMFNFLVIEKGKRDLQKDEEEEETGADQDTGEHPTTPAGPGRAAAGGVSVVSATELTAFERCGCGIEGLWEIHDER